MNVTKTIGNPNTMRVTSSRVTLYVRFEADLIATTTIGIHPKTREIAKSR